MIYSFLKKHIICISCVLVGLLAGFWGFLAGVAAGLFVEIIISRIKEEQKYRTIIEQGSGASGSGEPFPGALYACSLAVYCLNDDVSAARQTKMIFGKLFKADWNTLCRAAGKSASLNGDLLVECEASAVLHAVSKDKNSVPVKLIFQLLQSCEFDWDSQTRGQKPSLYLAQLLNYTFTNDELENAYHILGLTSSASMSQVKNAHRKLAAKYHPDTKKDGKEDSLMSSFVRVQNAYEFICKSKK